MRTLGAVSAVNLDGGGSTTMVAGGALVNRPSGGTERPDGDFVIARPRRTAPTSPISPLSPTSPSSS
jgi:exopolysaccharide biosynthesis protein